MKPSNVLETESLKHIYGIRASEARALPLVLLAGFEEKKAIEMRACLAGDCRIVNARTPREASLALPVDAAVLCVGRLLSPIEARHILSEAGHTAGVGPLLLLSGVGPDPAMFQDLIDEDRLFYLSYGEPALSDLAVLIRAALDRRRAARGEEPAPAALLQALRASQRVAAQPDLAGAGDVLQLAVEESLDADRAYCLLYDPMSETLWSRAAGLGREERHESSAVGLVSFVARTGRPVRIERAGEDPRFEREADDPLGEHCEHLLALAVRAPEAERQVLAVLCAVRDQGRVPFSPADEAALGLLADTVAASLVQLALATRLEASRRLVDGQPGDRAAEIFREEALEHHATSGATEGDWLRLSPRWTAATFWLLIGLVAAFLVFASVSRVGEYSMGPAVVRLTGRTELTASQSGLVTAVEVQPRQRVAAGHVLVRFQDAREAAELARIEREWELQLVERLRELSAVSPAQSLIRLRAERELARSRLEERVVRAPHAGVVRDVRCRPDQHVVAGDILLSLSSADSRAVLVALLPGEHRPLLKAGMPLNLELRGYGHAPQRVTIAEVADEVVGPEEAKRLLGPQVAAAIPLNGPSVRVEAYFPADTFQASGERYVLHDGMWGAAEVRVRSESLLAALVPGLRAFLERRRD